MGPGSHATTEPTLTCADLHLTLIECHAFGTYPGMIKLATCNGEPALVCIGGQEAGEDVPPLTAFANVAEFERSRLHGYRVLQELPGDGCGGGLVVAVNLG
jgi:hypothetical protein